MNTNQNLITVFMHCFLCMIFIYMSMLNVWFMLYFTVMELVWNDKKYRILILSGVVYIQWIRIAVVVELNVLSVNLIYLFLRLYPFLCRAVRNFARDHGKVPVAKEFYVAFQDLPTRHK